jgi:c-di-GMP phosphodiesterase
METKTKILFSSIILYIIFGINYFSYSEFFLKKEIETSNISKIQSSEVVVRSYIEDYLLSTQHYFSKISESFFKKDHIAQYIEEKDLHELQTALKNFYSKSRRTERSLMDIHLYVPNGSSFNVITTKKHKHNEKPQRHLKYISKLTDTSCTYYIEDNIYIFSIAKAIYKKNKDELLATIEYTVNMEYFNNILKDRFYYDMGIIDHSTNNIYASTSTQLNKILNNYPNENHIYKIGNHYKRLFFMDLTQTDRLAVLFDITQDIQRENEFLNNIDSFSSIVTIAATLMWIIITYIILRLYRKQNELIKSLDNKVQKKTQYINDLLKTFEKHVISSHTDLKGNITYVSEAYENISGYCSRELLGSNQNISRHPDTPGTIFKKMWSNIKEQKTWSGEFKNLRKNGSEYWIRITIEPYYENGKHIGYSSIAENITAEKQLQSLNNTLEIKVRERTIELERQLYIDNLTQLGSYYALSKDINECSSSFPVLMLINIDNFQNINNLYGYETGNDILKEFTSSLNSFIKTNKYKGYRLFADEFVIFQNCQYRDIDNYYEDLKLLKDIIHNHKFYIKPINEFINIDVTIGVSIGQENPIGTVDMALRYAKKHKLSFQTFHSELDTKHNLQNTIQWKKRIKDAIEQNRIVPVFQPILNRSQEIIKYEVLVRLQSEDKKKLIPPHEFLEEAVNAKQYNQIMKIVFDKTFELMKTSDKLFSINISYTDIFNHVLIKHLEKTLAYDNELSSRIIIEILETDEIDDSELMQEFINKFRSYGVRIAIDDFGVGHSNLSHITKINPDYLKIDGEFIKNINEDEKSLALVTSIITFCSKLNIKVIAEYVHSKEVFDTLMELGIDEFQGFYFSAPRSNLLETISS